MEVQQLSAAPPVSAGVAPGDCEDSTKAAPVPRSTTASALVGCTSAALLAAEETAMASVHAGKMGSGDLGILYLLRPELLVRGPGRYHTDTLLEWAASIKAFKVLCQAVGQTQLPMAVDGVGGHRVGALHVFRCGGSVFSAVLARHSPQPVLCFLVFTAETAGWLSRAHGNDAEQGDGITAADHLHQLSHAGPGDERRRAAAGVVWAIPGASPS